MRVGLRQIGNTTPIPASGQNREVGSAIFCRMGDYKLNGEAGQRKKALTQEREPMSKERERQIRVRRNRCHRQFLAKDTRAHRTVELVWPKEMFVATLAQHVPENRPPQNQGKKT